MSRLAGLFESCRAEGRSALIGYLPTGYPDVQTSIDAMVAMTESGCDIIEVGVPYSDPGMDGPVIATATEAALQGGVRVRDSLRAVEAISAAGGTVSLAYTPPADGEFVLVFVSRPVSDGKMFLSSSEYKLIKVAANADTSPIALGTLYTTRFGSITGKAGDKVFLRLVTVNAKGFASTHIQSTAIIGA